MGFWRRWFRMVESLTRGLLFCSLATALCAAQIAAVNLDGKPVDPVLASRGKVVVLIFVRTDCPISNRYAPAIQRLSQQYEGKVTFWLVYPDKSESAAAIRKHLQEYGYEVTALRDPGHVLVKQGQVQVTPEAVVFGRNGQLAYHGRIDDWYQDFGRARAAPTTHELADAIQAVIAGKPIAPSTTTAVGCYISDLE